MSKWLPFQSARLSRHTGQPETHRHTADVGVPDPGIESHDGRLERVRVWDLNVDLEGAASVGSVGRAGKGALEMGQVGRVYGLRKNARLVSVGMDVLQLLGNAPLSCRGHGGRRRSVVSMGYEVGGGGRMCGRVSVLGGVGSRSLGVGCCAGGGVVGGKGGVGVGRLSVSLYEDGGEERLAAGNRAGRSLVSRQGWPEQACGRGGKRKKWNDDNEVGWRPEERRVERRVDHARLLVYIVYKGYMVLTNKHRR